MIHSQKLKYLFLVAYLVGSRIQARTFNSVFSNGNVVVDAGTGETNKVLTTSSLKISCYDAKNDIFYLGDVTAAGVHSIVRAKMNGNMVEVAAIGGARNTSNAAPLTNLPIDKLSLTDDGDLIVLPSNSASFYIIKNPTSDNNMTVYASPAALDGLSTTSIFKNMQPAGKTTSGQARIVGIIPKSTATTILGADSCMRLYTFDRNTGTISLVGNPYLLNTVATTAGTLGELVGAVSGGLKKLTPWWDDSLQRLYLGSSIVSGSSAVEHSYVAVARIDESAPSPFTVVRFHPLSTNTAQNVLALKGNSTDYAVKHLQTFKSRADWSKNYLLAYVKHENVTVDAGTGANSRSIYVFPIADQSNDANIIGTAAAVTNNITGSIDRTTTATDTANQTFATSSSLSGAASLTSTGTIALGASYDARALVGGAPLPVKNETNILQVTMHNDYVYAVCVDKDSQSSYTTGVWASGPIYSSNGEIAGWTAWRKVYGSGGGAIGNKDVIVKIAHSSTGTPWFVGSTSANYNLNDPINNIGRVSWIPSELSNLATFNFSANNVAKKINTDLATEAQAPWLGAEFPLQFKINDSQHSFGTDGVGNTDLIILGGNNKVVMLSSGFYNSTGNDGSNFTVNDTNGSIQDAGIFSKSANKYQHYLIAEPKVGNVLCAEVARIHQPVTGSTTPNYPHSHGFIFVGGENGLAVLRNADGSGFDAGNPGTSLNDFTTTLANMSFVKIPEINEAIHALHSTCKYLYAVSTKNVYRIRLHSNDGSLFGATGNVVKYTESATMFRDQMTAVMVEPSVNLSNIPSSVDSALKEANSLNNQSYKASVCVIQKVMSAKNNEYFVDMVGFPNNAGIFVASIVAGSSKLSQVYTLWGDEAVCTGGVLKDSTPYSFPYYIRKMALRSINYGDILLANWYNVNYISTNGLHSATNPSTIANLVLFEADSISKKTTAHTLNVNGHVLTGPIATGNTTTNDTFVSVGFAYNNVGGVNTLRSNQLQEITANSSPFNVLINACDLVCNPVIFASGYNGNPVINHINLSSSGLASSKTTAAEFISSISAVIHAYGCVRLANGSMLLLTDKGLKTFE